jgi:hypothetical protein
MLLQHRGRVRFDWVHLVWALNVFITINPGL